MSVRISILMYHQVGDFTRMDSHRATYCHYNRFASQMAYLRRFGYNVISLDAAVRALRGAEPIPPRAVVLTFDDGYENFYQYAYPELKRHGYPAIVYLVSGLLGHDAEWFAKEGRDCPPLLGIERVRELMRAGIDFGAHSVSHVKLAEIGREQAIEEIRRSKHDLSALLDREVVHFCYPYGSYDRDIVEATRAAGYTTGVTCDRAAATGDDDLLRLPRKAISFGDSLAGYFWKLHMKNERKHDHAHAR